MHTTNYFDTFIQIAEDCPVNIAKEPPSGKPTIANLQYKMLSEQPYYYTSDKLLFEIYAIRQEITEEERKAAKEKFFSKGQACLRSSPLGKRYGWGIHHNEMDK